MCVCIHFNKWLISVFQKPHLQTNRNIHYIHNHIHRHTKHLQCWTRCCVYTLCQPHDDLLLNMGDARNENVEFFSHLKLDFHRALWWIYMRLAGEKSCHKAENDVFLFAFVWMCVCVCVWGRHEWFCPRPTIEKWEWNKREMASQQTHAKRENASDMMCVCAHRVYVHCTIKYASRLLRKETGRSYATGEMVDEHWEQCRQQK